MNKIYFVYIWWENVEVVICIGHDVRCCVYLRIKFFLRFITLLKIKEAKAGWKKFTNKRTLWFHYMIIGFERLFCRFFFSSFEEMVYPTEKERHFAEIFSFCYFGCVRCAFHSLELFTFKLKFWCAHQTSIATQIGQLTFMSLSFTLKRAAHGIFYPFHSFNQC